mmetsp:Transcript_8636/g.25989  ORF Transcript_8636/g.25989 Transcript_8636/m.25989 type:complete len:208 (+) Transcript_8636:150-773(+)
MSARAAASSASDPSVMTSSSSTAWPYEASSTSTDTRPSAYLSRRVSKEAKGSRGPGSAALATPRAASSVRIASSPSTSRNAVVSPPDARRAPNGTLSSQAPSRRLNHTSFVVNASVPVSKYSSRKLMEPVRAPPSASTRSASAARGGGANFSSTSTFVARRCSARPRCGARAALSACVVMAVKMRWRFRAIVACFCSRRRRCLGQRP